MDGQDTIHIHGDANVDQIVSDLQKIAQQTPGGPSQKLTPSQLDQVKSAIKDASVDVYSGTDDHLLRKLSLSLSIAPPAGSGVSSVKVDFSVTISDVNQPQTITAPSGAKPISGLLSQFGISGLGPLGSLGGAGQRRRQRCGRRRWPEPGLPEVRPAGVAVADRQVRVEALGA